MTEEIWKATKYPGYQVSNLGRVKGKRGHVLKPGVGHRGHLNITINLPPKPRNVYVHRLVLEAFVGPCPPGLECCHGDGNPANNRLTNLRWGTRSSNFFDQVKHGVHFNARKTHCPRGHELKAPNLLNKEKGRSCRACTNARSFAYARTKNHGEVWTKEMIYARANEYYEQEKNMALTV